MIAEVICKDCHSVTSLYGYVVREDLKYTKLAHLVKTELKTENDFDNWLKEKEKNGAAYFKDDKFVIDGEEVLDEFQRWEQSGCTCPECGSKNCYWV